MAFNLEELVQLMETGEPELQARVKSAVEWVFSKPEGREVLEEAHKLHGKPINIIATSHPAASRMSGYANVDDAHVILLHPSVIEEGRLLGENGESLPMTMDRFLFHEFKHGAQPGTENMRPALERMESIKGEALGPIIDNAEEKYKHRLNAARRIAQRQIAANQTADDAMLREIRGEMYDLHVAPALPSAKEEAARGMAQDELVQKHLREFEVPAMQFENEMVTKYGIGKPRTTDYAASDDYEKYVLSRKDYVDDTVKQDLYTAAVNAGTEAYLNKGRSH